MVITDGVARAGLLAGIEAGAFADEAADAADATSPVAVLRGEPEQLISQDY